MPCTRRLTKRPYAALLKLYFESINDILQLVGIYLYYNLNLLNKYPYKEYLFIFILYIYILKIMEKPTYKIL